MKKLFITGALILSTFLTNAQYTLDTSDVVFQNGIITDYLNTSEKDIIIPNNFNNEQVMSIGENAFSYNDLTGVILPSSIDSIAVDAFRNNKLTTLIIPPTIQFIGAGAFMWNQITEFNIPQTITSINGSSFWYNESWYIDLPEHYQGYIYSWNDKSSGTEYNSGDEILIEYNYEIGEKIRPIDFTITYHNTINPITNPENYTVEDASFTLNSASKDGYLFGGWYDNPNFQGNPITEITSGTIGDFDLYAKFVEETVTNISLTTDHQLIFYPNPCTDYINFSSSNKGFISILSTDGNLLLSSNESRIDVSALNSGVYIIIQGKYTSTFIKE